MFIRERELCASRKLLVEAILLSCNALACEDCKKKAERTLHSGTLAVEVLEEEKKEWEENHGVK